MMDYRGETVKEFIPWIYIPESPIKSPQKEKHLALKGFFDETGTHAGHTVIGVAGLVFDESRIEEFRQSWSERTIELKLPFHTVDCVWGRGQFEGWPHPVRMLLMHDLAEIIAKTKLAGFAAFVERKDWESWEKKSQSAIVQRVGSPYSACLLHCISMVRSFVEQRHPTEDVFYVLESGCDRQNEAEKFLKSIERSQRSRTNLKLLGHGFESRTREPILCASDFLAWEWQHNHIEHLRDQEIGRKGQWTSEFKILLKSRDIFIKILAEETLSVRALINFFHDNDVS